MIACIFTLPRSSVNSRSCRCLHRIRRIQTRSSFWIICMNMWKRFDIKSIHSTNVDRAQYDENSKVWRVHTQGFSSSNEIEKAEYRVRWLIVASRENAEIVMPKLPGMKTYSGSILHSRNYKNGSEFVDKKVLVVGCGNSGMEIALDLANFNAKPSIVVHDSVRNSRPLLTLTTNRRARDFLRRRALQNVLDFAGLTVLFVSTFI